MRVLRGFFLSSGTGMGRDVLELEGVFFFLEGEGEERVAGGVCGFFAADCFVGSVRCEGDQWDWFGMGLIFGSSFARSAGMSLGFFPSFSISPGENELTSLNLTGCFRENS